MNSDNNFEDMKNDEVIDEVNDNDNSIQKCEKCDFETYDLICLLDHNMIIHYGAFMNDQYVCNICEDGFSTQLILDDHIRARHNNNYETKEEYKDEENENINNLLHYQNIRPIRLNTQDIFHQQTGLFECPVCLQRFDSPYYLGDHFTENHQTFEDQQYLDDNKQETAFPSFEILYEIGVIELPYDREILKFAKKKCSICYQKYAIYNYSKVNKELISINTLDKLANNEYYIDIGYCSDGVIIEKSINKKQYIEEIDFESLNYPIIMTCCKNDVCYKCLRQYLMGNNLNGIIKCPFCMKDHTKTDMDYIRIIEIGKINKKAWKKWWSTDNRLDIITYGK